MHPPAPLLSILGQGSNGQMQAPVNMKHHRSRAYPFGHPYLYTAGQCIQLSVCARICQIHITFYLPSDMMGCGGAAG